MLFGKPYINQYLIDSAEPCTSVLQRKTILNKISVVYNHSASVQILINLFLCCRTRLRCHPVVVSKLCCQGYNRIVKQAFQGIRRMLESGTNYTRHSVVASTTGWMFYQVQHTIWQYEEAINH